MRAAPFMLASPEPIGGEAAALDLEARERRRVLDHDRRRNSAQKNDRAGGAVGVGWAMAIVGPTAARLPYCFKKAGGRGNRSPCVTAARARETQTHIGGRPGVGSARPQIEVTPGSVAAL